MTDFTPTHRITLASGEEILVSSDGAGPAYTREEWTSGTAADYERLSDGTWTCHGKAFAGEVGLVQPRMRSGQTVPSDGGANCCQGE